MWLLHGVTTDCNLTVNVTFGSSKHYSYIVVILSVFKMQFELDPRP